MVLAGDSAVRRNSLDPRTIRLVSSRQDSELLLLDAGSVVDLRGRVAALAELCGRLAFAELGDLAATLARQIGAGPVRAAIVARSPDQAEQRLAALLEVLDGGARKAIGVAAGVFLGEATGAARIGYLFPGQGSGTGTDGALRRRFSVVRDLYQAIAAPAGDDVVATSVAQPASPPPRSRACECCQCSVLRPTRPWVTASAS
ncbi:MAG TPA: hypothetical protein VIY52_31535 [Streptosporangiaceae bacterium]